jgi:hypothetical protein
MSFLVPARHSASRSALLIALRQASSSANAPSKVEASSVQRVDEQLALRQKQQAALRRSGRQMDIMSANIQVLGASLEMKSGGGDADDQNQLSNLHFSQIGSSKKDSLHICGIEQNVIGEERELRKS